MFRNVKQSAIAGTYCFVKRALWAVIPITKSECAW